MCVKSGYPKIPSGYTNTSFVSAIKVDNEIDMYLGGNLQLLIERESLTINRLSKLTKVPTSTLHGWLNGVSPKSLKQVRAVAEFFLVSIEQLCFEQIADACEKSSQNIVEKYGDEINAGVFEVILRPVKSRRS